MQRGLRLGVHLMALASLSGCGGGTRDAAPGPVAPVQVSTANYLNGNWLLAGTLPHVTNQGADAPGFAMSFTANGNELVGSGVAHVPCEGGISFINLPFPSELQGTVAADGSFDLQLPAAQRSPYFGVEVKGTLPKTAKGAWSGSYSVFQNVADVSGANCKPSQTGTFTAAPMADLTGTYTGKGMLVAGHATAVPVSVTVSLQQGGTVTIAGMTGFNAVVVNGTVEVEGTSCFRRGSIAGYQGLQVTPNVGTMNGNSLLTQFDMDSQSHLEFGGYLASVSGDRLVDLTMFSADTPCAPAEQGGLSLIVQALDRVD